MDALAKMAFLNQEMQVEMAEDVRISPAACMHAPAPAHTSREDSELPISMAALPNGQRMPLLKTLLTSACERNCNYCAFRAGRDFKRVTFKAEEMAGAVDGLTRKGVIQGAFLSSGVAGGGADTQDRLLKTAEYLRLKLKYRGYLHLKLMPGAERDQVLRAMQLADRVSVNLEGPNTRRLSALAPQKIFMEELLQPLKWVEEIRRTQPGHLGWNGRWPSSTTQFVVGAVGESDLELMQTLAYLNRTVHLARGYFSGFSPTPGTPFEERTACDPWREHRLYQASFLLRDYGFELEDLPFQPGGDLPLDTDPKLAWARTYLSEAPVEVNRAERQELLKVPGIGVKGVQAILMARRKDHLRSLDDLKSLGVVSSRAAPFILLDGHRPAVQLSLWQV